MYVSKQDVSETLVCRSIAINKAVDYSNLTKKLMDWINENFLSRGY